MPNKCYVLTRMIFLGQIFLKKKNSLKAIMKIATLSFQKLRLKATVFERCKLQEVDFGEADLTSAVFDICDLARAVFENTVLEKVDFLTACNFSIDPQINRIKKAKFSMIGLVGLLDKYGIEVNG